MGLEALLFALLGLSAIVCAIGMLVSKNAVHSAIFLIGNFGAVAVLFLLLDAPFISMVQIAVYAGAIMVLFLFVIMLLGAEQTSDASQSFRWVASFGMILGVSFLLSLAIPLLSVGGLQLPETAQAEPMIRVVHGAQVLALPDAEAEDEAAVAEATEAVVEAEATEAVVEAEVTEEAMTDDMAADGDAEAETEPAPTGVTLAEVQEAGVAQAVTVTIANENLPEPLVIDGLDYSDVTDFVSVPPGANIVTVSANDVTLFEAELELERGQIVTAVAYGIGIAEADFAGEQQFNIALAPNSLEQPGNDRARLSVVNGFSESPVSLVDIGANGALDIGTDGVVDFFIGTDIPFGGVSEPIDVRDGTYELRFLNGEAEIIGTLVDYHITEGTETTIVFVPDYDAAPNTAGEYRSRVLDRAQETLTFETGETFGSPRTIGLVLFTDYLLPVNLVGMLLFVALIGVIVLTRPEGQKRERRADRRRKVSRPLVSVISDQTESDVIEQTPRLDEPDSE